MKRIKNISVLLVLTLFIQSCSSVKVIDSWKAEPSVVDLFKSKNVLVIARTSNDKARTAFEHSIAKSLRDRGIKATESYSKLPNIHPEREMSEERVEFIKSLMQSEGFTAVVLTVIKDKTSIERTTTSGVYFGATYNNFYPGYYGGFYDYFSYPYAYGSYYNSFGGYVPVSTNTRVIDNYVLETVTYNLEEAEEKNQLVAVVTTSIKDPNDAYKTADDYVEEIFNSLEKK